MALGCFLRSIQLLNLNVEHSQEHKSRWECLNAGQLECDETMVTKHISKWNCVTEILTTDQAYSLAKLKIGCGDSRMRINSSYPVSRKQFKAPGSTARVYHFKTHTKGPDQETLRKCTSLWLTVSASAQGKQDILDTKCMQVASSISWSAGGGRGEAGEGALASCRWDAEPVKSALPHSGLWQGSLCVAAQMRQPGGVLGNSYTSERCSVPFPEQLNYCLFLLERFHPCKCS